MRQIGLIFVVAVSTSVLILVLTGQTLDASLLRNVLGLACAVVVCEYVFMHLSILVHEMGHYIAGRNVRFTFANLSVGPIEVRRSGSGLRLGRSPNMAGVGGFLRMVPSDDVGLVPRLRRFVLGGPIASLVWAAITIAWANQAYVLHDRADRWSSVHLGLLVLLAATAVALLPGTLIPYVTRSGLPTDMRLLLDLAPSSETRDRVAAEFVVVRELMAGIRPRDYPTALIERLASPPDGSERHLRALLLLYYQGMDGPNPENGIAHLKTALAAAADRKPGHMLRDAIYAESAYVAAWLDDDAAFAQSQLDKAGAASVFTRSLHARAQAAIALRSGRFRDAFAKADEADRFVTEMRQRFGGNFEWEQERVAEIRSAASQSAS